MTHDEFISLVAKMRKSQKSYFRSRSPLALQDAKALEKAVDAYIEQCETGIKQPELYQRGQRVKYYCENCGSEIALQDRNWLGNEKTLCPLCGSEDTDLQEVPAYETVAAWEKRKGAEYPDTAPVYFTHKERNAEWLAERYLFVKDRDWLHVLVATEAGAPPNGWTPEK